MCPRGHSAGRSGLPVTTGNARRTPGAIQKTPSEEDGTTQGFKNSKCRDWSHFSVLVTDRLHPLPAGRCEGTASLPQMHAQQRHTSEPPTSHPDISGENPNSQWLPPDTGRPHEGKWGQVGGETINCGPSRTAAIDRLRGETTAGFTRNQGHCGAHSLESPRQRKRQFALVPQAQPTHRHPSTEKPTVRLNINTRSSPITASYMFTLDIRSH